MDLNQIVGAEVINSRTARFLATVCDVVFNAKMTTVKGFLCFDSDERECFLPCSCVQKYGEYLMTGRSRLSDHYPAPGMVCGAVGKAVLTADGNVLGRIKTVIFENGKVEKLISDGFSIAPKHVLSVGDRALILKTKDVVDVQQTEAPKNGEKVLAEQEKKGAFDFLLSMRAITNLYDHNGVLLIPSGKILERSDLDAAIAHDKIIELCCVSRKVQTK